MICHEISAHSACALGYSETSKFEGALLDAEKVVVLEITKQHHAEINVCI